MIQQNPKALWACQTHIKWVQVCEIKIGNLGLLHKRIETLTFGFLQLFDLTQPRGSAGLSKSNKSGVFLCLHEKVEKGVLHKTKLKCDLDINILPAIFCFDTAPSTSGLVNISLGVWIIGPPIWILWNLWALGVVLCA